MAGTVYALLVGVDSYEGDVPSLAGCENDIAAAEQLLPTLVASGTAVKSRLLLNEEATRNGVIAGFRDHLGAAGDGDVALFWYSGHGSQQPTAEEFAAAEPDGLDETLVCHDSRTPGSWDLADKELATLVAEVSARGPHVLVVLDCCHSGSGVRATAEAGERIRRAPLDGRERRADTYLGADAAAGRRRPSGWELGAQGRYVLLAACRSDETAKETRVDGEARGAFSAALGAALAETGGRLSYGDLVAWAGSRVRGLVARQNPQLESADPADATRAFLGGAVAAAPTHYRMLHAQPGWFIDAGSLHGIPAPHGDETVLLDIRLPGAAGGGEPVTTARVVAVEPHRSRVEPAAALQDAALYHATVAAWPVARMGVVLDGDADALAALRAQFAGSRLVEEVAAADAEVRVEATGTGYRLGRSRRGPRLAHEVDGHDENAVRRAFDGLERMARWQLVRDLANPAGSIRPDQLELEIRPAPGDGGPAGEPIARTGEIRLAYQPDGETLRPPQFTVTVTNRSTQRLFVAVLFLDEEHAVDTLVSEAAGEWLAPGESLGALKGEPLEVEIPDHLLAAGVTEVTDVMTVLACTEEFDARRLVQPALGASVIRGVLDPPKDTVLDLLLDRAATRKIGVAQRAGTRAEWQVATQTLVVERPRDGVALTAGTPADLGGVSIVAPAGLAARARLVSLPTAARDLDRPPVPPALRDPELSEPFPLVTTRGDTDLSVLEVAVELGAGAVTPQTPLVIRVPGRLAEDEHVLPVVFDGEYWLPVGRVLRRDLDHADIAVESLPAAVASSRDLWTSVRVMFRKLVGRRLGLSYDYPRLAVATVSDGAVRYDVPGAAAAVAAAETVLIYVHGIIGDTGGMVRHGAADHLPDHTAVTRLDTGYDVVLAFDYENIHTRIEETARDLKDRLGAVGLGPGHGKAVDIVAHSMGGLVTRWLVEQEGGAELVRRVVLAGTPHLGSPWPSIQGWATTALGFALNGLATTAWPVAVLGGLVQAIERVDNALDQMQPGSDLLVALGQAPDPGTPYVMLTGDRGVAGDPARAAGLLSRLRGRNLLGTVATLAFLGDPNDLAVSVASASGVPMLREPRPEFHVVGCDHMTYFSSAASAAGIRKALA